MATRNVNQTVQTDFKQTGVEAFQRQVDDILNTIQSLPDAVGKANGSAAKLLAGMKQLGKSIQDNKENQTDWSEGVAKMSDQIKTLAILTKGVDLFKKADLAEKAEALAKAVAYAKALRQETESQFRLEQKMSELRDKQNRGNGRLDTDDLIRKSGRRADPEQPFSGSMNRDQWKYFASSLKGQMTDRVNQEKADAAEAARISQEAAKERARLAKEAANAQRAQARADAQAQKEADRAAAAADAKIGRDVRGESNLQYQMKANYERNKVREEAAEQARADAPRKRIQARGELATGEGAASLLLVQGALMANSALLSGVIGTIKETIDFSVKLEAAFRNVEAVTATTRSEMSGLENTIKQVSTTTKFSALEVAEAALTLGQAGLSTKQIAESIQPVITLANAAGSSIAQAVDLVTSVVGVFDKNSSDVADIANKITQAANGSKVSVDKLALGFQYAGNTAAQLGISFEEVTAAMAAMSNAGIKSGSTMGTGLRQFLTEVQKPSEGFLTILGRLGLSISDLDFRSKGFIGVIKTLKEAGFVAGDAIQSFDVRGAAAFNALLARPEDLQAQFDALNNTQAAVKANEIQMDSLSAQSSRLTNILGVMASTGFDPVIKTVTAFIRALNDGLGAISDWRIPLELLGTALAGLAAAGVTAWIAPLIGGMASVVSGLMAAAAGTTTFSAALVGAGALAGTVGLAVTALIAAFQIYSYLTGETARNLDLANAAVAKSKGALQEKDEVLTSLNNKLEQLAARENSAKDSSTELATQIAESSNIVNKWGFSIDSATSSLGGLASQLRAVRKEIQDMRLANFSDIVNQTRTVADVEATKLKETAYAAAGTARLTGGKLYNQKAFLDSIPDAGKRAEYESTLAAAFSGKGDEKALGPQLTQLVGELKKFQASNSQTSNPLKMLTNLDFGKQVQALEAMSIQGGATRQANFTAKQAYDRDYRERADVTLERARGPELDKLLLAGNLADTAKQALSAQDQKSAAKISDKTVELIEARTKLIKEAEAKAIALAPLQVDEKGNKLSEDIVKSQIQDIQTKVKQGIEKLSDPLRAQAAAAGKDLDRQMKNSPENEEFSKIKGLISHNNFSQEDVARGEQILRNQGDMKYRRQALGKSGEDLEDLKKDTDEEVRQNILKFQEDIRAKTASAGRAAMKSEENSFKAVIDAMMKDARSQRGRANANMPIEDIEKLIDTGLAKIAEAKREELASINRQYGAGSVENKNLTSAANEKYEAAAQTFIGGFSGLIETVTDRIYNIQKYVKATDAKLKKIANDGEEELYRLSGGLRDNDREQALNSGAVSGRRRTDVDAFNTANNRNPLELANAQQRMAQVAIELAATSSARDIAAAKTAGAQKQLDIETAARDAILKGRDSTQLSSDEASKLVVTTGQIKVLTDVVATGEGAIEKYTDKLQKLRTEKEALGNKAAGLTELPERAQSWDELTNSVNRTFEAYQKLVSQQDVMKVVENGLFNSFQGIQGQFSTFFTNVVTGTMSVGQAFKAMAANIIKSMVDVLAQALALQAVKSILGAFMGAATGGATTGITGGAVTFGGAETASGFGAAALLKADGGAINGGIPGKDSVPVLAMPGEYMLKKSAVDVLGHDYLDNLNKVSNSSVTSSSSGGATLPGSSAPARPINIWVVSPDQVPSGGPDDVIATVSDNISRGGSLKKLIKTVAMGG